MRVTAAGLERLDEPVRSSSQNLDGASRFRANRAPTHLTPQSEGTRLRDVQIDPHMLARRRWLTPVAR